MNLFSGAVALFRRPASIQYLWPSILVLQLLNLLVLYVVLPGRVGQKQSPFQPDSIMSFCLAGQFLSDLDTFSAKLFQTMEYFSLDYSNLSVESCSTSIIETYKTRLLLPMLISISSLFGPWWFMLLPTALIFIGIGRVYSLILNSNGHLSIGLFLVGLLPFMSPHVTLHLASVLSEGPATLAVLCLVLMWRRASRLNVVTIGLVLLLSTVAVMSRQVWPIASVICALIAYSADRQSAVKKLWSLGILPIIPLVAHLLVTKLGNNYIKFIENDQLSDLVFFDDPVGALTGSVNAFLANLLHTIKFFDIPMLVLILLTIPMVLRSSWRFRLVLGTTLAWGALTTGSVYLVYGSIGDNWRFLVLFFILVPLAQAFRNRNEQNVSSSAPEV